MVVPIYISPKSLWEYKFFYFLDTVWYYHILHFWYSSGCVVISHCNYNSYYNDEKWSSAFFHIFLGHLDFLKFPLNISVSYLNWVYCFTLIYKNLYVLLSVWWDKCIAKFFSHFTAGLFHLWKNFWRTQGLNLNELQFIILLLYDLFPCLRNIYLLRWRNYIFFTFDMYIHNFAVINFYVWCEIFSFYFLHGYPIVTA